MAVTEANLTTLAKLLKTRYGPRLHKQFVTETPIATRIQSRTSSEDFSGKEAIIGAHWQRSEAVGARAENGSMPRPQYNKFEQMTVGVAYIYGAIKITRPVIKAARDNAGSFTRAMQAETQGIRESLLFDGARQMVHGDGTGKISTVTAAAGATTFTCADVINLRIGMVIDIWKADNSAKDVDSAEITDVDYDAKTITLAATSGGSASPFTVTAGGAYVTREDSKGAEMMGLHGIIDDGSAVATFQGIARSGARWLKAQVMANGGTPRTLTTELVDQAYFKGAAGPWGGHASAIYSRPAFAVKYAQLLFAQRQFTAPITTLDGGFKAVQYTGPMGTAPWIMDRMCRDKSIYFPVESDLGRWQLAPVEFIDEDGSMWQRALDGTDAFQATIATYQQVGAHRCNQHVLLADITNPW